MIQFSHYLQSVIEVSIHAGDAIMEVYGTDFMVEIKTDKSPLTKADTNANAIIMRVLNETGLPVISEEGRSIPYHIRETWDTFWLVDPLDGTKEFVNRNGEFTVNIALIHQNKPILGVIYAPVTDVLYFSDDTTAWKLDFAKGNVLANSNLDHLKRLGTTLPLQRVDPDFTIVASRSHLNEETTEFINLVKREHDNMRIVSRGSSLKMCMIAEGLADIYPRFGPTHEWDTAAGHAIVLAAGGKIVHYADRSQVLDYNTETLVNPAFLAYAPDKKVVS